MDSCAHLGAFGDSSEASGTNCYLHLELAEFPVGCAPRYQALSYAWGPPVDDETTFKWTDRMPVVLEQEIHDVTLNLFDAITELTMSYRGSYFWIDALCINQNDLHERQTHVAVMDRIYRNADEVIIWLGKAKEHSADVFELVRKVSEMDDSFFHAFGYAISPDKLSTYGLPNVSSNLWGQYLDLYERKWFSRGWVIQEVVLAKRAVAHWGSLKIPFDVVLSGSRIFLPERLRKDFFARLRETMDVDRLPLGRNAYRIGLVKEACIHKNCQSLLVVEICTGTYGLQSAEHILVHLMRMSRDFQWSDPRDRIYSILGLVNFTSRLHGLAPLYLKPDYGKTSTEASVLTTVATAVIKRSGYLGIIAQVSDLSFKKCNDLPSWVPDFSRSPNFAMGRRNLFNACTGTRQPTNKPLFRFCGRSLFVMGNRIGTVQGAHVLKLDDCNIEGILSMLEIAYKSRLPLGEDRMDALWRTMIWDIYGHAQATDDHPAPSFLANSFLRWIYSVVASQRIRMQQDELSRHRKTIQELVQGSPETGGNDENQTLPGTAELQTILSSALYGNSDDSKLPQNAEHPDPESFTSHASGVTWNQQLFFTDTGYLGMGPKSGKEGDEVWIISGCPFPMVLRRHIHNRESYCDLGRAYVHGVMHGEAITEKTIWEEICLE
ncbi:hypothetical protein NQ176_g1597 [Zarea fungicola]|uniref:Uncharacterized protein n=1 Tax=Zarea fungicola TaxID=93591 RepID=A0ACC1NS10_9HYPO|nr:hypothetical protein NQ176_g1597 [Lecanicillium fungicola]